MGVQYLNISIRIMKVLPSLILGVALGQDYQGFDYDGAGRNQASQSSVGHTNMGQGTGIAPAGTISDAYNPNVGGHFMGNGLKCWYCDARTVYDCFNSAQVAICQGQEYFCFYHERRKIGHYFNRREKYIDNERSGNSDAFLIRSNNEAMNSNDAADGQNSNDRDAPSTNIHVMAGCQQPQACLRQQQQNNGINIGVRFYSDNAGTNDAIGNGFLPTSRQNAREGLCRLGNDWGYYSGKMWSYDSNAANAANVNVGAGDTQDLRNSGIIDANLDDGHQFFHERESWYNGMRANGFPDRQYHGGKGTESVCHFCCNPGSSDGHFCNRNLLDKNAAANTDAGMTYSSADVGNEWLTGDAMSAGVNANAIRADVPNLGYNSSPMQQGFNTNSAWLTQTRYHGMYRNPETQVYQNFIHPNA